MDVYVTLDNYNEWTIDFIPEIVIFWSGPEPHEQLRK